MLELQKDYMITKVEHVITPEALLVDVIVKQECSIKDAIKCLLNDEMNSYSKNKLYSASLRLKNMFL